MKFLVFGSLNIDKVYKLSRLPEKGETLYCTDYSEHVGGKGLNQAVSLSKAGEKVFMAGGLGTDGGFLSDFLNKSGVDTSLIKKSSGFTGQAVIEVDSYGQNQMILTPGANHTPDEKYCDKIIEKFAPGDVILMQYETSAVGYMMQLAHSRGLTVAFNPSPYTDEIKKLPLGLVDYFILNEYECRCLTGEADTDKAVRKLSETFPDAVITVTLGGSGSVCVRNGKLEKADAFKVDAVDTTGAGDTFTGYFLSGLLSCGSCAEALRFASAASAIVVTETGAAETIPEKQEVCRFLEERK